VTDVPPDSYTDEELRRCSLWALTDFSGPQYIFVGLRDRAMLLFSATTAFQGENSRMLQWSDLFRAAVPLEQTTKIEVSQSCVLFWRLHGLTVLLVSLRSWPSWPTMPSTTSKAVWTNMEPSGITTQSSVQSVPSHCSSLHISTS
jgi:hypothetical protein